LVIVEVLDKREKVEKIEDGLDGRALSELGLSSLPRFLQDVGRLRDGRRECLALDSVEYRVLFTSRDLELSATDSLDEDFRSEICVDRAWPLELESLSVSDIEDSGTGERTTVTIRVGHGGTFFMHNAGK
jgi:hypothetical protein